MSDIRWEGLSHEEIYSRVQQGPGRLASSDAEAAWNTVESTIRAVDAQLTRAVKQIGAGWQGRAADAVHGGMTVMSNWALDAAGDASLTKTGITAQAEQAARLRSAMPPPRTAEWNRFVNEQVPGVGLMSAVGDLGALEERMANDHAVAVDMMNRYSSQSSDNQRMMNYWTPPPTVVVEAASATPARSPRMDRASVSGSPMVAAGVGPRPGSGTANGSPPMGASGQGDSSGTDVPSAAALPGLPVPGVAKGSTAPSPAGSRSTGGLPAPGGGAGPGRAASPALPGSPPVPGGGPAAGTVPGSGGPGTPPRSTARLPGTGPDAPLSRSTSTAGVRPIVPGPPLPGSGTDQRTGPRNSPGTPLDPEPSARLPRTTTPGAIGEPRVTGVPAEGAAAGRGQTAGHGILPMGGGGAVRPVEQDHRRPAHLIDDSDAFADDRWFPPPVISGDTRVSRA
jgi:hypothetical protein